MDKLTALTGETNYLAPFIVCDILVICAMVALCFIDDDIGLPKSSDTMKGVKIIFSDVNIIMFIVVCFICGTMFGNVETFLFVFLKVEPSNKQTKTGLLAPPCLMFILIIDQ